MEAGLWKRREEEIEAVKSTEEQLEAAEEEEMRGILLERTFSELSPNHILQNKVVALFINDPLNYDNDQFFLLLLPGTHRALSS
jgi:hypothetical protein